MNLDDMYDMAGHWIRRAAQTNTALFMSGCAHLDLTTVQFAALVAISEVPGVDVTRLSSLIAYDRTTVAGVINRLEAKGLALRASAPNDLRAKLIYATPAGAALLKQSHAAALAVDERLLKPLSPDDRKTLKRILKTLVQSNIDSLPPSVRMPADSPAP